MNGLFNPLTNVGEIVQRPGQTEDEQRLTLREQHPDAWHRR